MYSSHRDVEDVLTNARKSGKYFHGFNALLETDRDETLWTAIAAWIRTEYGASGDWPEREGLNRNSGGWPERETLNRNLRDHNKRKQKRNSSSWSISDLRPVFPTDPIPKATISVAEAIGDGGNMQNRLDAIKSELESENCAFTYSEYLASLLANETFYSHVYWIDASSVDLFFRSLNAIGMELLHIPSSLVSRAETELVPAYIWLRVLSQCGALVVMAKFGDPVCKLVGLPGTRWPIKDCHLLITLQRV